MEKDVIEYLQKCTTCKVRNMREIKAPIQEVDRQNHPFQKISLDIAGPFPVSNLGNKYILSFVDCYSAWPECYPLRTKGTEEVIKIFHTEILPRHGCPDTVLTDNGAEFTSVQFQNMSDLKIKHIRTAPYHPQSNGKNERQHRTINDILAKHVNE